MALNFGSNDQKNPPMMALPGPATIPLPGPGQVPMGAGPQMQPAGIFQRLATAWQDPNIRQAVATAGLNLMRTPAFGQNGFDTGANAIGAGIQTLQALRERDRARELEAKDRAIKEEQRGIENKRGDRQVGIAERNAQTNEKATEANIGNLGTDNSRLDKTLDETIRHNQEMEKVGMAQATAANTRANNTGKGTGKTSAEIEKINRMKAYYMQQNPQLSDADADKLAMDYVSNSKGKTPRQQVLDAFQAKAKAWLEMQYDPTAQPTPDQINAWKAAAIQEVKDAEKAAGEVTSQSGPIVRPNAPVSPTAPTEKSPMTEQKITTWKSRGGTPDQIRQLLIQQGENPVLYGY